MAPSFSLHIFSLYQCLGNALFCPVLILPLMFPFCWCVLVSYLSTSSRCLLDHRARRKSIATGKQPSMEVPPTAPIQPFRQSVSNPPCSRPRSLPPTLSLSLLPAPALGPPHTCGRRASGTPPHPFPPSLAVSPSPAMCQQQQQQQQKGTRKGPGTPPLPRSLPLSPSLSFTLPHSPAASSTSPPFLYWGGDWRAAGSSPVAGGTFIAPLPPFEVCDTNMAEAETHACFNVQIIVSWRGKGSNPTAFCMKGSLPPFSCGLWSQNYQNSTSDQCVCKFELL